MTRDLVLTPIPQRTTSQESAWENGKYETYRLGFAIPAVRLHERGTIRTGSWFAGLPLSLLKFSGGSVTFYATFSTDTATPSW